MILVVVADDLKLVARENHRVTVRNVQALRTAADAAHVDAETFTKMKLLQRFATPGAILRHLNLTDVDISIQQMTRIERTLLAVHLGGNIARTQVVDKEALHHDAALLDVARCHHQQYHHGSDADDERIGEAREVVDDVEDERQGDDVSHHDGEEQRDAVDAAFHPQALPFRTVVLFHHDGAQERRNQYHREQTRKGVGIPVQLPAWQQIAHQRQHEGEHHGDGCRRKDRVGDGVDSHLADERLPFALLLRRRMAHRKMVQNVDELVGQMLLHHLIGRQSQTNHVGRKEGGNHGYSYHHRIEEVADNPQRQAQRSDDKRELTYLSHRKTAAHRRLQRFAAQHESEGAEYSLSHQDGAHQGEDRNGIFHQYLGVYQHTHRHEEDGAEEIFHRFYQFDNLLSLNGFCKDAAHNEGSEGAGEPHLGG